MVFQEIHLLDLLGNYNYIEEINMGSFNKILVFDLETIRDLDMGKRYLHLDSNVPDEEVNKLLDEKYRKTEDEDNIFLKPIFWKIISIGALKVSSGNIESFGALTIDDSISEKELLDRFLKSITQEYQIVTYNGNSFDLPILRYRAMYYKLNAGSIHKSRYNNRDYWYRFGKDHIDLCDILSGYNSFQKPSLEEVCALIDIPVKIDGMKGNQVKDLFYDKKYEEISQYCETDVLSTYILFLRYSLVTTQITEDEYNEYLSNLYTYIEKTNREYLKNYL